MYNYVTTVDTQQIDTLQRSRSALHSSALYLSVWTLSGAPYTARNCR